MLKLNWKTTHAGAPDNDGYATAEDRLFDESAAKLLQSVPKTVASLPAPSPELRAEIDGWIAARGRGRAVVLVHGYSYNEQNAQGVSLEDDPYHGVYSVDPAVDWSWVHVVGSDNAVAFSWTSAPGWSDTGRACWTNPYEYAVYDISVAASRALAAVIAALDDAGLTVDLFAHSLGTRAALKALGLLAAADRKTAIRRAVLLGGAEYSIDAWAAVRTLQLEAYNFVIRGDLVLKWGASELGGRLRLPRTVQSRVIGRDGMKRTDRWIDFQLDHADPDNRDEFADWFRMRGYGLSGEKTGGRGLHWAYYLHAENRRLFADILRDDELSIAWFKTHAAPEGVDRFRYGQLNVPVPKTPATCRARRALYR